MLGGYTTRIYVPDGDADGIRIVDKLNWTGKGIVFPRTLWDRVRSRPELLGPGVYILSGYKPNAEDPDLPTVYIGQGEVVQKRIDAHEGAKDFWDRAAVFVSTNGGLHRGHITWLEFALVARAAALKQCYLDNGTSPQEPVLPEADKADTAAFLSQMLQILPLVGVRVFEKPRAITPSNTSVDIGPLEPANSAPQLDTIVVPAQKEGFDKVFLGEDSWHAIRIGGGMIPKIRYIAGYQSQPVSAITHYAKVDRIEPYSDSGKYRVLFAGPALPIGPIPFGDAPQGTLQGPRYTTFSKLTNAKKVMDLF